MSDIIIIKFIKGLCTLRVISEIAGKKRCSTVYTDFCTLKSRTELIIYNSANGSLGRPLCWTNLPKQCAIRTVKPVIVSKMYVKYMKQLWLIWLLVLQQNTFESSCGETIMNVLNPSTGSEMHSFGKTFFFHNRCCYKVLKNIGTASQNNCKSRFRISEYLPDMVHFSCWPNT